MNSEKVFVWFCCDLCDYDYVVLSVVLVDVQIVYCVFVFDSEIFDVLLLKCDCCVYFICELLVELNVVLQVKGGGLIVFYGRLREEIFVLVC